uniref:EXS domain-containing protein n=1 Tax=Heligmosomoides polygyrus TaxID=6339 RepID=A0A183GAZ6_HELPZ
LQLLSIFLFYWSGIYCRYNRCGESLYAQVTLLNRSIIDLQYFPILSAPLIAMISLAWLITNFFYANTLLVFYSSIIFSRGELVHVMNK